MHLIWEDEMQMMIASNAKEFLVFDEEDPEKSTLLRRVIRAHQEEVTISAYSYHLSLVATGCINGEIALYDFETSKVEGLLLGHTGDITAIEFMDPYPALISASMDYTIAIWGVRPCPAKLQNVCLKRLTNLSWRADADVKSVATRILLWQGVQTGVTKHRRLKDKQLPVEARRRFENNIVFSRLDLHKTFKQQYPETKYNQYKDLTDDERIRMVERTEAYKKIIADEIQDTFMTIVPNDRAAYNQTAHQQMERIYLYIGDEQGYLKLIHLTPMIQSIGGLEKVPNQIKNRAFNPRRAEIVDTTQMAKQMRRAI
jgi:hypothetical protein